MTDRDRARASGNPSGKPVRSIVDRRLLATVRAELDAAITSAEIASTMAAGSVGERMQRDEARRHAELAAKFLAEYLR